MCIRDRALPLGGPLHQAGDVHKLDDRRGLLLGLVKGASKGEGLGNKFLANIRETRCV